MFAPERLLLPLLSHLAPCRSQAALFIRDDPDLGPPFLEEELEPVDEGAPAAESVVEAFHLGRSGFATAKMDPRAEGDHRRIDGEAAGIAMERHQVSAGGWTDTSDGVEEPLEVFSLQVPPPSQGPGSKEPLSIERARSMMYFDR